MRRTQTRPWDPAEYMETSADMAAYLEAALEDGDPGLIAAALGDIARAKGMAQIARESGLGRESLYKALSPEGNPEFATVLKVLHALGLRLHATEDERAGSDLGSGRSIAEKAHSVARTEFKGRSFSRAELYNATVRRFGHIKSTCFLTADWSVNQKSGYQRKENGEYYKPHTFLFKRDDGDFELYDPTVHGKVSWVA